MTHLVISSSNAGKLQEISEFFSDFEVVSLYDVLVSVPDFVEDGETFEENAIKKLQGLPLVEGRVYLSDDSGIEVACLGGGPGIHSARYAGVGASSAHMCEKLLHDVRESDDRSARFVCVIAMAFFDGRVVTVRGEVEGRLAEQIAGSHGFGYDPIFIPEGYDQTYAQLGNEVKLLTSHRSKALIAARLYIGDVLSSLPG
jgi:non-canonical purine NTP pyrophosphatase (RdgB/HAM1 family)